MGSPAIPRRLGLALAALTVAGPLAAQTPLIPANPTTGFWFYGPSGFQVTSVAASGPGFTRALRVTTDRDLPNSWDSAFGFNSAAAVAQGDVLRASFWVRKRSPLDGTGARGSFDIQRDSAPWTTTLSASFPADSMTWRRYSFVARAAESRPAGGTTMQFKIGRGPQSFEIGGWEVVNHGPNVNPQTLEMAYYYPGRDLAAPWRTEAWARIEAHRKANVTVRVEDVDGRPIDGAQVELDMVDPEFRWGSAVVGSRLTATDATNRRYQDLVRELFTTTVMENDMKWPFIETWSATSARTGLAWLQANGLPVRGHNLIWPSWRNMPEDTETLSAAALRTRIDNHFNAILTEFQGDFYDWDVQNEPYDNFDVQGRIPGVPGIPGSTGVLGNLEAVRWFQRARALDPAARLTLNDYNVLENDDPFHRAYTIAYLRYLLDNGAPVDQFGFQGHFNSNIQGIEPLRRVIQQFAAFPVRLAVTEYDLPTLDEQLQADFLRDFMTLVFSEPQFDQFLKWGFWEGAHWIPTAGMLRLDFSEKPAAGVWRDLIFRQWWTDLTERTPTEGTLTLRGFRGDHRLRVSAFGQAAVQDLRLNEGAGPVTVRLSARVPRLVGRVSRPDWAGGSVAGQAVNMEVRTPGTATVVRTLSASLASDGSFRIFLPASLAPGTFDLSLKLPNALRQTWPSVGLPASGQVSRTFTPVMGDVDGDNAVTVFDYDALSAAFDTSAGDPAWNPLADLDGDGTVTVFDYDILSRNFDRVGD